MDISVYDCKEYEDRQIKKNHNLMPQNCFRCVVSGTSSSGKTNLVCNMILKWLEFDKLFVFSPSIDQPKYLMLRDAMEKIQTERDEKVHKLLDKYNQNNFRKLTLADLEIEDIYQFDSSIPDDFELDKLNPKKQTLVVLDDIVLDKDQSQFISLFSRGRHKNVSVLYLSQSFYDVPKLIRRNASCYILFGPLSENELHIIRRDIGSGVEKKKFIAAIQDATREQYSFAFIDKNAKKKSMEYRKGFEEPLFE